MKKLSALMLLSATMILASCGKPAESKPEESKPAETSQTQSESKPASTPESKPASTPASSSKPASTPASSSKPASTPASSAPTAEITMTLTAASLVTENNVNYIKLSGTSTGLTAANGKFALGLKHKDSASSGLADPLDGEWLVGGETPAAADFKHVPTIAADGKFDVKLSLAGITFVKGAYEIFVGPQGHYEKLDLEQTQYGGGTFKTNGLGVILRSDIDLLFAEELPPVVLTEAVTLIEGEGEEAKVFLKVGGELGSATAAEFLATTVKVTCERQVGGWQKNEMAAEKVTNVVDGTKGYVKIDVTALAEGGYQVKLGFDGTSAPDTKMECDSYDKRNEATVLGNKAYAPYFQAGGNSADTLYGCCGLYISHAHTFARPAEKEEGSALYRLTGCSCTTVAYDLDVADADAAGFHAPAKMKSDATWNITGIEAGQYQVFIDGHMSTNNGNQNLISNATAGNDSRYSFQAGTNDMEYITNTKTVSELGWEANDNGAYKLTKEAVATMMINGTDATFKMFYKGTGYSIFVNGVRLVKVGNYVAPSTKLTADTTRIEAEASHTNSSQNAGTVTEDETLSGGSYVKDLTATSSWWSTNYGERTYNVKALAAGDFKVKVAYKSATALGFELLVDGASKGTMGAEAAETFTTVETEVLSLTKGEHSITIKGIKDSKVDLDYIEVVKVTPAA